MTPYPLLVFFCASCALETDVLLVPAETSQSMLLAILKESPSVIAIDSAGSPFFSLPFPDSPAELYLHRYDCSLEELGLVAGTLALQENGRPIPSTADRLHVRVENNRASPWESFSGNGPDLLAEIRIEHDASCAEFVINYIPLPGPEADVLKAVPLTDQRILLVTTSSRAYVLHEDNRIEVEYLPFAEPSAVFERNQEMYVTDKTGRLQVGSFDAGFVDAPSMVGSVAKDQRYFLTASPEDGFLFGVGLHSTFERYDGVAWHVIATSGHLEGPAVNRAVVALGPREAIALTVGTSSLQAVRYSDGEVRRETITTDRENELQSLAVTRSGPAVGTQRGAVYIERNDSWDEFVVLDDHDNIRVMTPLDEGLLLGGRDGYVIQFNPLFGTCEPLTVQEDKLNFLLERENGFIAVGEYTSDVTELVRRNPRPKCD